MTKHALVLSPLRESPRHLSQNFSSSFFKDEGFLPFKEAPGISFSVRIVLLSADEELDNAMISLLFTLPRPFRPRFHALGSRPFRAAAIYEYGVLRFTEMENFGIRFLLRVLLLNMEVAEHFQLIKRYKSLMVRITDN